MSFYEDYLEHARKLADLKANDPEKAELCELLDAANREVARLNDELMEAKNAIRQQVYPTNAERLKEALGIDIGLKTKEFRKAVSDFKGEVEAKDVKIKELENTVEQMKATGTMVKEPAKLPVSDRLFQSSQTIQPTFGDAEKYTIGSRLHDEKEEQ